MPLHARRYSASCSMFASFPDQLESGVRPRELGPRSRYRQIVEPPCRVFYRFDGRAAYIVHVMRAERILRRGVLTRR
ncbi:MAG: hypothetical protein U1F23_04900 [Lysobacterales bacterium]